MDKAREQHNTLMEKGSEQLTAFGVSCYMSFAVILNFLIPGKELIQLFRMDFEIYVRHPFK